MTRTKKKARIRIEDLPEGKKINKKDMKLIFGGPNRRQYDFGAFNLRTETDDAGSSSLLNWKY